jgi:hypothetical protein
MSSDIATDIRIDNIRSDLQGQLFNILDEFHAHNLTRAMREGETLHALAALCELRRLFSGLVIAGYPFQLGIQAIDAGMARLRCAIRPRLAEALESPTTRPEDIPAIHETLAAFDAADSPTQLAS